MCLCFRVFKLIFTFFTYHYDIQCDIVSIFSAIADHETMNRPSALLASPAFGTRAAGN